MQSSAPAGGASGRPTSQCLQHIDFKREKKSTIYLKFQNVLVISSKTASRAQPRTWTNWELAASPWGEENGSVSRVYTCGYRRVLRNAPQEQRHDRREKHRAFTAALLLTDKLQTADVSKRRAWPAARDGDEPGPGPRWGTARTADLFPSAPSGWVSVYHLTSLCQFILFGSLFSSFAIFYFGLNGWMFMIQPVPLLTFVSIIYLSEVSLKITIFIFIFLWFTLTQSHPSLSYKDLHDSKATPSLSCLVYSLPLKFRVVISPCFVFCCLK